jgi:hypothetical protein
LLCRIYVKAGNKAKAKLSFLSIYTQDNTWSTKLHCKQKLSLAPKQKLSLAPKNKPTKTKQNKMKTIPFNLAADSIVITLTNDEDLYCDFIYNKPTFFTRVQELIDKHHKGAEISEIILAMDEMQENWNE